MKIHCRKQVKKAVGFVLILLLLLSLVSGYCVRLVRSDTTMVDGRDKSQAEIAGERENSLDVLFAGDSLGICSFSPMQLWHDYGFTSFSACQTREIVQETYAMLKTAFETQKPKVVVLETNVFFRRNYMIKEIVETAQTGVLQALPVFMYHDIWKSVPAGNRYPREDFKGFKIYTEKKAYKSGSSYMKKSGKKQKNTEISPITSLYMERILSLCEENGAELMMVSAPSPDNYSMEKHDALQAFADAHGLRYVDMNLLTDEIGMNWKKDSMDKGDHLNIRGAKKATAYMGEVLTKEFALPDHRGDAEFEDWDVLYGEYEEALKGAKE